MSKTNDDKQIDADILQCKKDILRADDIMPPYKKTGQEAKAQKTGENAIRSAEKEKTLRKDTTEAQMNQTEPGREKTAEPVRAQQEKSEIPRFDLAEEIMAEQRKISAIKRKAPGKTIETQKEEPVGYTIGQPTPGQPYQEQIIAEIVARDIESLFRDGYLADSW